MDDADGRERFEREVASQRATQARCEANGRRSFSLWVWLVSALGRKPGRPN